MRGRNTHHHYLRRNANSRGCPTLCGFGKGWVRSFPSLFSFALSFLFSVSPFISTCPLRLTLLLVRRTTNCSTANLADESPMLASQDSHACSLASRATS